MKMKKMTKRGQGGWRGRGRRAGGTNAPDEEKNIIKKQKYETD